jgi:phage FluMu gp28-like protein
MSDEFRQAEARDWCERNLAPLLEALDPNLKHYFGQDFGRNDDLTVIAPGTEMPDLTIRLPFLLELRNVPFREQEFVLFYVLDRLPRFMGGAMDSRGNGQFLAEFAMQRYGAGRILQVMLSQDWYRNNMPRLKASFEDETTLIPKHADVLTDLRAVKMDKGVPKVPDNAKSKGTDGGQRHGDSAIALVMLQFGVQEAAGYEMEYQTSGPRRMSAVSGAW